MDCKQTDVKWPHRVDDRSHRPALVTPAPDESILKP